MVLAELALVVALIVVTGLATPWIIGVVAVRYRRYCEWVWNFLGV